MAGTKVCPYCGVPKEFSKENTWNSDGTITQTKNPDHRVLFYEAEGMNRMLANLEQLVGVLIDRIVIEGKRKSTYNYLQGMFSGIKLLIVKALLRRRVYETISARGAMLGYGHYELLDLKAGEFIKVFGRNIYSRTLFSGDIAAVFNLVEGIPAGLEFEEKDGGTVITVVPGEELEEEIATRLERKVLMPTPGDIAYDRCPKCGIPLEFKDYTWDLEAGTITDDNTGRRMAILGSEGIESVFRELEAELGEEISRTIIEAQRIYVVETLHLEEVQQHPDYLVRQLALRGMGNVVSFDISEGGIQATVENALPHLLVVGLLQGIFELFSGKGSDLSYDYNDRGTLTLNAKTR
ncbi:MAG: hypothetical protein JW854_03995 [Actinobacteria bacterium]|nr:hypothetical protein [Actinomycetota bacterium]